MAIHDGLPSKFIVVVTVPDELATERPEVIAMPAYGYPGQAQAQRLKQERRER